MPPVRRRVFPDGDIPVSSRRERDLVRRVFLRGRRAPLPVSLRVTIRPGGRRARSGNGIEPEEEDATMAGDWGTVILIAVVVLVIVLRASGGG